MIPPDDLLPVWKIANLWAEELRGTAREVLNPDVLIEWMCRAFVDGRLRICGPHADYVRAVGPADSWRFGYEKFLFSKPERDDFLRWVEAEGYPRPQFWGAETPAKAGQSWPTPSTSGSLRNLKPAFVLGEAALLPTKRLWLRP